MPPRLRLHHAGIVVSDLERAAGFYGRWFGFDVVGAFEFDDDDWMNAITGLAAARGRALHLRGESGYLELFAFDEPVPASTPPAGPSGPGITHLGFEVDDVHALHAAMAAEGVDLLSEPQDPRDGSRALYGRDPDGNLFELMQLGGPSAAFSLDAPR
jgi:catechol 2,3-dioxygenase-like lactoylglutathione lyase family enzyme